jgi:hypothetical protein
MIIYIKGILKKIKEMEMGYIYMKMVMNLMEYLKMIKKVKEKGIYIIKMVIYCNLYCRGK